MFTIIIGGMKAGECRTFQEAYKEFYERIMSACASGIDLHYLMSTSQIEYRNPFIWHSSLYWMNFNQARDFAHQLGLLNVDGELQKPCIFISFLELDDAFSLATEENIKRSKDSREEALCNPNGPT